MGLNEILKEKNLSRYKLSQICDIPYTTLTDLCTYKTRVGKCSVEIIYKIAKALSYPMNELYEMLVEAEKKHEDQLARERSYEYGLPQYLQDDLDNYKKALKNKSSLLDCYWGELYGSINDAEIGTGSITSEHANYLRKKYLWG